MKTYKLTIPAIEQIIEAESEKEARDSFWDNFDTYNEAWPQDGHLQAVELVRETTKQ